jgi:hypothetical protein
MDKVEVVRRQLGTALHLFLIDADPVSVHTLASAACEIAEHLTRLAGRQPFSSHALPTFVDMKIEELRNLQRKYYNAFKHMTDRSGAARDDSQVLEEFQDEHNDAVLFIGWYDYLAACEHEPLEAQVFQAWFFAMHPEKLVPDVDPAPYMWVFPKLKDANRNEQKAQLREVIERYRGDPELMNDPRTDRRPLMMIKR